MNCLNSPFPLKGRSPGLTWGWVGMPREKSQFPFPTQGKVTRFTGSDESSWDCIVSIPLSHSREGHQSGMPLFLSTKTVSIPLSHSREGHLTTAVFVIFKK